MQRKSVDATTISDELYNATGDYFEPNVLKQLYASITGNSNATYSTVAQLAVTPKGFTEMNQTTIKVGGNLWDVMYLTKAGNNVVLTLCASFYSTEKFNPKGSSNSDGNNPGNMYGTSYVRASLMSGDGQSREYNNGPNALTTLSSATALGNKFAQYTTGNFAKYILTPEEALYQETENNYGRGSAYDYTLNNDAFGTPTGTLNFGSAGNYEGKPNYDAWKNDLLWLPSVTEMGTGNSGGLWKTDSSCLNRGSYWMTRSAACDFYHRIATYTGSNIYIFTKDTVNYTCRVYPAFHLNLTLAGGALDLPEQTSTNLPVYNGLAQTFDFTSTSVVTGFDSDKMEITGISRDGGMPLGYVSPSNTASTVTITEAGTYTVNLKTKATIENGVAIDWKFSDTGTDTAQLSFVVKKKSVAIPSFSASATPKEYTGSKIVFGVPDYPNTNIPATATEAYPRDALEVQVSRTLNGINAAYTDDFSYCTANYPKGLEIGAVDVGEYTATIKIKDDTNYEWSDGGTGTKTASFTVKAKELSISYTTTVTGDGLSWSAEEESNSATFIIGGLVAGDSVGIKVKLSKDGDSTYTAEATANPETDTNGNAVLKAVVDKSTFGGAYAVGSYTITFEFDTAGADNGNYTLETALTSWNRKLVIEASGAGLTTYTWQYSKDSGTAQAMPADKKLKYAYNNLMQANTEYRLEVDTTGFSDAHIAIDTSKYTNGYEENVKDRAGSYTTKVALKSTDPNYLFTLSDGTKSATMDVEIEWEIEKGDIDLSNVKWQYTTTQGNIPSSPKNYPVQWNVTTKAWEYLDADGNVAASDAGLPWYGEQYTLSITGFPTGVTINNPANAYNGTNKKKFVGSYTTECVGISYDTANYNALPADVLKLNWQIVKAKIEITSTSWSTQQEGGTAEGVSIFYVPVLQNVAGVEYEYWDLGTAADPKDPAELLGSIGDITSVSGTEHKYFVKAKVKSGVSIDGTTLWEDAIELVDKTNPPNGDCTKEFTTGDSRTPVQVTLNGAPYTYDGKAHAILDDGSNNGELSIQVAGTGNNFAASNFTVKYYIYDETATDHKGEAADAADPTNAPKNAGKYVIEIQLTSVAEADYYTTAKYVEYEIKAYQLDMSQVKWGYDDGEGNEVEYDPTSPLQYELDENGAVVEHEIVLIGLPRGDADSAEAEEQLQAAMFAESKLGESAENGGILRYAENKKSAVGNYTAECVIGELSGNFVLGNVPAQITDDGSGNLTSRQDWRIISREITGPKNDDSAVFSGEGYDLLALGGLNAEDVGRYYKVNSFVTKNEFNETVPLDIETVQSTVNAGEYEITLELMDKSGTNVKWLVNGSPKLTNQKFKITINKLKITVTDWEGEGEEPYIPTDAEGNNIFEKYPGLIENAIADMNDEPVEGLDWSERWNERFKQRLKASEGNEGNIEFEYAEGVEEEKIFQRPDEVGNESQPIARPTYNGEGANAEGTGKTLTFNGETQDFTPENLEELKALIEGGRIQLYSRDGEGNETAVGLDYFKQRNAGKYVAIIRINGNYKWSDTNDKTDVVMEYEIEKAEISGEWGTDEKGMPILTGVSEKFADKLVYEYRDADGKVVAEEDLTKGKEYTVSVRVSEEESGNIILRTESGEEAESLESMFTVPGRNTLANMIGLPEDFPLIQVALTVIFLILFLIFLIMWIRYHKQRKAAEEIIEEYQNLDL